MKPPVSQDDAGGFWRGWGSGEGETWASMITAPRGSKLLAACHSGGWDGAIGEF